jgi:hypothetical protein
MFLRSGPRSMGSYRLDRGSHRASRHCPAPCVSIRAPIRSRTSARWRWDPRVAVLATGTTPANGPSPQLPIDLAGPDQLCEAQGVVRVVLGKSRQRAGLFQSTAQKQWALRIPRKVR